MYDKDILKTLYDEDILKTNLKLINKGTTTSNNSNKITAHRIWD